MSCDANIYGVILAGGSGTRLWPLSRKELPKQFLAIDGEKTLLQSAILRLMALLPQENIRVVAGREWKGLVRYQAAEAGCAAPLLIEEPEGRNTAPAIALAIAKLIDEGAAWDDIAVVCPSDHIIKDEGKFNEALKAAFEEAGRGMLVVFGVTPDRPETGFGYIKIAAEEGKKKSKVLEFVEKPDSQTAEKYLKANENSSCRAQEGGVLLERRHALLYMRHALENTSPNAEALLRKAQARSFNRLHPFLQSR